MVPNILSTFLSKLNKLGYASALESFYVCPLLYIFNTYAHYIFFTHKEFNDMVQTFQKTGQLHNIWKGQGSYLFSLQNILRLSLTFQVFLIGSVQKHKSVFIPSNDVTVWRKNGNWSK